MVRLVAGGLAMLLAAAAQAQSIPLVNPSFELPNIPTPPQGSQDQADFVLPFIDGWVETGPVTNQQGFSGLLDTGVFINTPVDLGGGVILPPIPNADGNQLAFMQVNTDAGTAPDKPLVSIWQETAAVFEPDKDYTFTIGIGLGVIFPATSDDETNNPATLHLSLGYLDDLNGGFIGIQNLIIKAQDVHPTDDPNFPPLLQDISVIADAERVAGPTITGGAWGNEIVVKVTQIGGTSGGFNLDKARLSAVPVPEPGSLALLVFAGVGLLRRRRR